MSLPAAAMLFFSEQVEVLRRGDYWDCRRSATRLAELLRAEGRAPWIGRLRRREVRGDSVFHAPLTARVGDRSMTWTTHYVCVDGDVVHDPVAGEPLPIAAYSRRVFDADIDIEPTTE